MKFTSFFVSGYGKATRINRNYFIYKIMRHTFKAKIYKTGINWCVDVPAKISGQMIAGKGRVVYRKMKTQ